MTSVQHNAVHYMNLKQKRDNKVKLLSLLLQLIRGFTLTQTQINKLNSIELYLGLNTGSQFKNPYSQFKKYRCYV